MNTYLTEDAKKDYTDYFNSIVEKTGELKLKEFENAIILPFDKSDCSVETGGYVLDSNKERIPYSVCKGARLKMPPCDIKSEIKKINKTAFFLGHYNNHWGHFLVESMTRLWPLIDNINPDYDYIFIPVNCGGFTGTHGKNCLGILELFGFKKEQIKFAAEPVQYDKVIIPETTWGFEGGGYHKIQGEVFNRAAKSVEPSKYEKVYFSRRKLELDNLFGEDKIENVFKDNGYKVIYPEKLSTKEQIAIVKGAKHLAGISGSALHIAAFASSPDLIIEEINRLELKNDIQLQICKMKNINLTTIKGNTGFLPVLHGPGPFMVGLTDELFQFFKDNNFKVKNSKSKLTKNDIANYVIRWTKTYCNKTNNKDIVNTDTLSQLYDIHKEAFLPLIYFSKIITKSKLSEKTVLKKVFLEIERVLKRFKKKFTKKEN